MKKVIAVVMGGYSSERKISLQSGRMVAEHLDRNRYEVLNVDIKEDMWVATHHGKDLSIDKNDFSVQNEGHKMTVDYVINMIHGTPGEDGRLLAYFEMLKIPFSSCGSYQAAITFNKRDCIAILKPWDITVGRHVYINQGAEVDVDQILERVGLPCFVKANRSGSSYGVSKVYRSEDLIPALDHAYKFDNEAIIESFLQGIEVSVGVLTSENGIQALPPTEIRSENDFFDYEAKYQGKAMEITPAEIDKGEINNVQQQAVRIYKVLKLKGIARIDFIYHNHIPHFIEVNTVPGMSPESIIPKQLKAAGIDLQEVLSFQIAKALNP